MKWASQWAFLLLLPSAYAGKRACSDASSDAEGNSEAPEAPVLPVAGTPVALGTVPVTPPAAPPTVPPSSLEAIGAARALRSACSTATSSISTRQGAPVSKAKSKAPAAQRSAPAAQLCYWQSCCGTSAEPEAPKRADATCPARDRGDHSLATSLLRQSECSAQRKRLPVAHWATALM